MLSRKVGSIGFLTFNNIKHHNATTYEMWKAIPNLLKTLEDDPEVHVVVVEGAGEKSFISGSDISEFEKFRTSLELVKEYNECEHRAYAAMKTTLKPLLAAIQGFCMGGGVTVALNSDIRIAREDALFCVPPAKLGIGYPKEAVEDMTRIIGSAYTKDLLFTARKFDATEALQMGLVTRIVKQSDWKDTIHEVAETIAANAPLTIKAAKVCIDEWDEKTCLRMIDRCYTSDDYVEGQQAFKQKRTPIFVGK
jgi:enoyl-CoA hydratase